VTCCKKPKKVKNKTHKGIAKRIKITGTGKVMIGKPGRRHLALSKTAKRRRQLRRKTVLQGKIADHYKHAALGIY